MLLILVNLSKLHLQMKTLVYCFLLFPMTLIAQPDALKKPVTFSNHGISRTDDYFWMNERDSKEVLDYINVENEYSAGYFTKYKQTTETLLEEFNNRIDPNETSAPMLTQGSTLQFKNKEGSDYREIYRTFDGKTDLFFNENTRAKGKKFYQLGDFSFSTDNSLFAFSEDVIGRRKYTIHFMDVKTGKILKDEIPVTDGSVIWANDNKTVYYIKKDENTLREFQVYRHTIGSKKDELIFEDLDELYSVYLTKTIDDAYICINSVSTTTSKVILLDANNSKSELIPFIETKKDHLFSVEHTSIGFYLLSNFNAPNRQILHSKELVNSVEQFQTVISHRTDVYIEEFLINNSRIVLLDKNKGTQQIANYSVDGQFLENIQFNETVYELSLDRNEDINSEELRFYYQSFTTPFSLVAYNYKTKSQKDIFKRELRDRNYNPNAYTSERIWITAKDGTKVPVSLVYKKGIDLKSAPLLLYGYGSYGITIPCSFSATRISLLDRGFVFAVAHIRGGKFLGEEWYQDGKLMHKMNTFTDFIDCAIGLASEKYCDPNKIYAMGGSAGGLLMGAVANLAPETFKGMVAQVPFVDVMNTMLDANLPLTVGEYEEWGNPNEKEAFEYMMRYSPYDNVEAKAYPSLYITTGYHDSQVQYWEPLKWTAKLRDYNKGTAPVLFNCTFDGGHGGGSGVTNQRLEIALVYTYLLSLEGIEN